MARNIPRTVVAAEGFERGFIASDKWADVPGGIVVAASARDGSDTFLRGGLFLVKLTGGPDAGKYTHFSSAGTNGQNDASTGVVLMHNVDVADGDMVAAAYTKGDFFAPLVRGWPAQAADLAKINQRLILYPYVA